MKIALASPPFPTSIADGLKWIEILVKEAAAGEADIICFPESYLPGYPGMNTNPEDAKPERLEFALQQVCKIASANNYKRSCKRIK